MKRRLEVERMTDRQLWSRAFMLIGRAGPLQNQGPHDLDLSLKQLDAVLNELKLRGKQLALVPETYGLEPRETPRGIGRGHE
jgi:hypothetical protein